MLGSEVRMPSSTTMPRLVAMPASLAIAAFGRMPTAMTTSVAARMVPSSSSDALDLAVADDGLVLALVMHLDAARLDRLLQQIAGGRIELALHQRRHEMQHGDVHAARLQAGRGLEAEQAAADDDRLGARLAGDRSIKLTSSRSR
jgi:hypothetical protein